jgi:hypothetical protein
MATLSKNKNHYLKNSGSVQVVDLLPCKHKALTSNPSITKKKKKKNQKKQKLRLASFWDKIF